MKTHTTGKSEDCLVSDLTVLRDDPTIKLIVARLEHACRKFSNARSNARIDASTQRDAIVDYLGVLGSLVAIMSSEHLIGPLGALLGLFEDVKTGKKNYLLNRVKSTKPDESEKNTRKRVRVSAQEIVDWGTIIGWADQVKKLLNAERTATLFASSFELSKTAFQQRWVNGENQYKSLVDQQRFQAARKAGRSALNAEAHGNLEKYEDAAKNLIHMGTKFGRFYPKGRPLKRKRNGKN